MERPEAQSANSSKWKAQPNFTTSTYNSLLTFDNRVTFLESTFFCSFDESVFFTSGESVRVHAADFNSTRGAHCLVVVLGL